MPTYSNGYIPANLLITFASGTNGDGYWEHQLSAGTLAKHRALVARAKQRTGKTLQATPGWSCYRPYKWQVVYRDRYGNGAAVPGTSSHGGVWEGRQTLAIDYHNWATVYGGDQAAFFADARAVGLSPGMIMRSRGYPDEPWHLIDMDPWAPAPASAGSTPFTTASEEDDNMIMLDIKAGPDVHKCALGEGIFKHFVGAEPFQRVMLVSRSADDWQPIDISELPTFLATYGCDRNIWDFRDANGKSLPAGTPGARFVVLDPLTGSVASGNTWTASGATRAAIAGIKAPALDPAPIVNAVKVAIEATGVKVDGAAIAAQVREAFRQSPLS
jgi:hypothetical protein